jgi:hypothetical protein
MRPAGCRPAGRFRLGSMMRYAPARPAYTFRRVAPRRWSWNQIGEASCELGYLYRAELLGGLLNE